MADKIQLELSWDKSELKSHTINYDSVIKRIRNIPNPYVGNKKKLLFFMGRVIEKYNLKFGSFLDAFSGSSVVGLFMKGMGKKVLSNDVLASAYFHAVALVENNGVKLSEEDIHYLINNVNPNRSNFIQNNWTSLGKTALSNRFTKKEAIQLDNLRANIRDLSNLMAQGIGLTASSLVCMRLPFGFADRSLDIYNHRRKQVEKYGKGREGSERRIGLYYDDNLDLNFKEWFPKYVRSIQKNQTDEQLNSYNVKMAHAWMIHGVQSIIFKNKTFSGGRWNSGQVLRNADDRIENFGPLEFTEKEFQNITFTNLTELSNEPCIATNCDIIDLLQSGFIDVDCAYFDPPYGGASSDYGSLYRFFEEFIYEDTVKNLPHFEKSLKRFSNNKTYEENFVEMLDSARHIPIWILSCNDSSWMGLEYIVKTIKKFRKNVTVDSVLYNYNYRDKKKKVKENEHLIVAR